jgi:non-ribosomal peptide synthetase component E (peptide arylation enzyme)
VIVPADEPPTLTELCGFLEEHGLAKFKFPEQLLVVDELPTNPGGKVDKVVLQSKVVAQDQPA